MCKLQLERIKGFLPGEYALQLLPSRRNSSIVHVQANSVLLDAYRAMRSRGNASDVLPALPRNANATVAITAMISGVRLNGRTYSQGSIVEYLPYVPRRGNRDGIGGRVGSSQSYLIGCINMMYVFQLDNLPIVLVDITGLPIVSVVRSLYVVERPASDMAHLAGFTNLTENMDSEGRCIIHIDSITSKIHLAPHFTDEAYMCAIRMWTAR